MKKSRGAIVEQLIRPTGLTDPDVIVVWCAIRSMIFWRKFANALN